MGAVRGNQNAIRHGLCAGSLPAGARYIKRLTGQLQVALERAVLDRRGEVDVFAAAVIQSAMRWERHALLAQKWLRITPDLDPDQKLAFSREIARASSERDKCLRLLGLDVRASANVLDTFYSGIGAGEGPEGDHEANGPTGATPEADTGPGDGCEVPSAN